LQVRTRDNVGVASLEMGGKSCVNYTVKRDDEERVGRLNRTRRNVDLGEIISVRGVSSDTSEDAGETASARAVVASNELKARMRKRVVMRSAARDE